MIEQLASSFDRCLEEWVIKAIQTRPLSLAAFLHQLPSVYPASAISTLELLVKKGDVISDIAFPVLLDAKQRRRSVVDSSLPLPHPLDFEWRFTHDTAKSLLAELIEVGLNDPIAMLGTPTLYKESLLTPRHVSMITLLDSNPELLGLPTDASHEFRLCDLLRDPLPDIRAGVIIADAPWYPHQIEGFLRAASHMALAGASVYVSLPAVGARPGVEQDMDRLFSLLGKEGLQVVERRRLVLEYETPHFEANALRAAGIENVPTSWRRGDLAVFKIERGALKRTTETGEIEWEEIRALGTRIRVRFQEDRTREAVDPRLTPLVDGDVLPSISVRDHRRRLADVWTSGNRVFSCRSPRALTVVAKAVTEGLDPLLELKRHLRRSLTDQELNYALESAASIRALIKTEAMELCENAH